MPSMNTTTEIAEFKYPKLHCIKLHKLLNYGFLGLKLNIIQHNNKCNKGNNNNQNSNNFK